ncbi:MAG: family transcriptional regulator, cyclic receptor protein [Desulfovibrionales bacterium]|jgi:CRP-like cAMP-binding protein|nr:family transcriptional regulator, cyclic receptor protein [Desulfovibrionales bacterium]
MLKSGSGYLVKSFLKHHVIFTEGSKGEEAYVLLEGRVEISGSINGRKKVFAVLKPVSIFGEMALFLGDQARTATAVAMDDCKVVIINSYDLEKYIEQSPQIVATILNVLVSRLKVATKRALQVPNLHISVCRIFDLFAKTGQMEIPYDHAVRIISDVFLVNASQLQDFLKQLAADGLISIEGSGGKRSIVLLEENFLERSSLQR